MSSPAPLRTPHSALHIYPAPSRADVRRRRETDFSFPPSAHNIHYGPFIDWQAVLKPLLTS